MYNHVCQQRASAKSRCLHQRSPDTALPESIVHLNTLRITLYQGILQGLLHLITQNPLAYSIRMHSSLWQQRMPTEGRHLHELFPDTF